MNRTLVLGVVSAIGIFAATAGTLNVARGGAAHCTNDAWCNDGVFCNGVERCTAGPGNGCVPGSGGPCVGTGLQCNEMYGACLPIRIDADGDGHASIASGGDDCDDGDPSNYPGNHEVCDSAYHDEDCNPDTFGFKDSDGDGEVDARCCNYKNGSLVCGTDVDDGNYQIRRGTQVCDGANVFAADLALTVPCPTGTVCIQQPSGAGVCGATPPGYTPPAHYPGPAPTTSNPPPPPPPKMFSPYKATAVPPGISPPTFRRAPLVPLRTLTPAK